MKNLIQSAFALSLLMTASAAFAGPIEDEVAEIESSTVTQCTYLKTSWGLRLPGLLFYSARFECKGRDIDFILRVKAKDTYNPGTNQWDVSVRGVEREE